MISESATNGVLWALTLRMADAQLAEKLKEHGLEESEASIASKISRGTFAATFFLAVVAALELEGVQLGEL